MHHDGVNRPRPGKDELERLPGEGHSRRNEAYPGAPVMVIHRVQVYPSKTPLPKAEQLAWKIAEVANAAPTADAEVAEMVINRIIDNAGDRKSTRLNSSHLGI